MYIKKHIRLLFQYRRAYKYYLDFLIYKQFDIEIKIRATARCKNLSIEWAQGLVGYLYG